MPQINKAFVTEEGEGKRRAERRQNEHRRLPRPHWTQDVTGATPQCCMGGFAGLLAIWALPPTLLPALPAYYLRAMLRVVALHTHLFTHTRIFTLHTFCATAPHHLPCGACTLPAHDPHPAGWLDTLQLAHHRAVRTFLRFRFRFCTPLTTRTPPLHHTAYTTLPRAARLLRYPLVACACATHTFCTV